MDKQYNVSSWDKAYSILWDHDVMMFISEERLDVLKNMFNQGDTLEIKVSSWDYIYITKS